MKSKTKWNSTRYPGVRYREHQSRKHGIKPDRYYAIRYQHKGKRIEEGLGWASEGWTESKCVSTLAELKNSAKTGSGSIRLSEKREKAEISRQAKQVEKERLKLEGITFSEYFTSSYYPDAKHNKSHRSYTREESLHRIWIAPVIGDKPLKDISPIDLERISRNMLKKGRSPRSAHYALATIRQVFNRSKRDGVFIGKNPVANVRLPKYDNRRHQFLTQEQADLLLIELQKHSSQLKEMALVSLHCGLRAGEIFALTWGDVNLSEKLLMLCDTKGTKNRPVFMTGDVKSVFSEKQKGDPNDLVFPGRGGVKIKAISRTFSRVVKGLGFNDGVTDPRQKVTFHTLRHTHASWLVMEGVDLYTVQNILGHATLAMTQRYAHLAPDHLRKATSALEKKLKTNRQPSEFKLIKEG